MQKKISEETIHNLLKSVKDPEIPAISVVELGMIKKIAVDKQGYTVTVTPTFSGCPAKEMILHSIREQLESNGVQPLQVEIQLTPAWTVDDIDPACYDKLIANGIAPPAQSVQDIACPRCGSKSVTQMSFFGSTACKSQFSCTHCTEPFEYFKGIRKLKKADENVS